MVRDGGLVPLGRACDYLDDSEDIALAQIRRPSGKSLERAARGESCGRPLRDR